MATRHVKELSHKPSICLMRTQAGSSETKMHPVSILKTQFFFRDGTTHLTVKIVVERLTTATLRTGRELGTKDLSALWK